jgi:hypothetical protein
MHSEPDYSMRVPSLRRSDLVWRMVLCVVCGCSLWSSSRNAAWGQARGSFYLDVVEKGTNEPLVFRAQVRNARDQIVKPRGVANVDGWSLVDSSLHYRGAPGDFSYHLFRGPEFAAASGGFTLDKHSEATDVLRLDRYANLASEGWYGGDLASRIPAVETRPWLVAEGLHMAVSLVEQEVAPDDEAGTDPRQHADVAARDGVGPSRDESAWGWTEQTSFEDRRGEGGLVIHHWQPPTEVPATLPSSRLLIAARGAARLKEPSRSNSGSGSGGLPPVHCEISRPWASELPIWLASQRVDSFQLLGEHLTFDGQRGLPVQLPVPFERSFSTDRAAGMMVEQLYWQILEAGLRIPPTAGSGFGRRGSPLGYNRVYAYCESLTAENWWEAMRAGRSFVTNGPLLRVQVNEQVPGHIFFRQADEVVVLDIAVQLTVADPVQYLDVIYNGQSLYEARLDEFAKRGGRIPSLKIEESGWLVVRVVTERDHTYRLATTAPYYFEFGGQPRISRAAVEYFRQWLSRIRVEAEKRGSLPPGEAAWQAAKPFYDAAAKYWDERLAGATCD